MSTGASDAIILSLESRAGNSACAIECRLAIGKHVAISSTVNIDFNLVLLAGARFCLVIKSIWQILETLRVVDLCSNYPYVVLRP
jgi:hypothetical protein